MGFPQWLNSKESACNVGAAEDAGSLPELGWPPGGGHSNPLQYSCLENPMDRGAWRAIVQRVTQSLTQLKRFIMHSTYINTYIYIYIYIEREREREREKSPAPESQVWGLVPRPLKQSPEPRSPPKVTEPLCNYCQKPPGHHQQTFWPQIRQKCPLQ